MDFSTIAKRTRSRDPEYYRWLHEKLRNERDRASANVDGQASSSEARSGNSAGQSVGGGRSSTDPSNSTGHNVLDCEDEEEEQRKLKKQKPNISKKMTQGNKGRQRVEAPRTIRELERATQEAERKKEKGEAHKKILEWRPMREAISMKADASNPKGKANMKFGGSSNTKDKNVVHIDDEETEPDASSEDSDIDTIALPKQQKAKAEVKVEGKEERILITDLKHEVEETVAAQRSSNKNIITEPAYEALDDDSDDNIAFSENQNATADVELEEQETFLAWRM